MTIAASKARPSIRCMQAELLGFQRERVAIVSVVIAGDDDAPEVIMFNGDPFLHDRNIYGTAYRQVRPFRCDTGA